MKENESRFVNADDFYRALPWHSFFSLGVRMLVRHTCHESWDPLSFVRESRLIRGLTDSMIFFVVTFVRQVMLTFQHQLCATD